MNDLKTNTDSSWYEGFFTAAAPNEKQSLWDNILNATGDVISSLPDALDDKWWGDDDDDFSTNSTQNGKSNITSIDPTVSAKANASLWDNKTVKYSAIGGGVLVTTLLLYLALKSK